MTSYRLLSEKTLKLGVPIYHQKTQHMLVYEMIILLC